MYILQNINILIEVRYLNDSVEVLENRVRKCFFFIFMRFIYDIYMYNKIVC